MRIAVLGAGGGGLAVAYEWTSQGHEVALYAQHAHEHHLVPVRERGGIQAEGKLEGFVSVATVTTDIAEALDGVDLVFVVGPAYATEPFGRDTRGHLRPGMTVVVCPSSCVGSLAFKQAAGVDLYDESIVVGETSTLPYASRASLHASVRIFHRFDTGFSAAAAPRSNTPRLLEVLRQVYRNTDEAAGIFQTTLQNGNPVIHPAVTLLNAALIERTGGDSMFYEEGVTEAVGRLMKGGRWRAAIRRQGLGRGNPRRAGSRGSAGLHERVQLLHRLLHRTRLSWHQGAGRASSPLPDRGRRATQWCSSPTWLGTCRCRPPPWMP